MFAKTAEKLIDKWFSQGVEKGIGQGIEQGIRKGNLDILIKAFKKEIWEENYEGYYFENIQIKPGANRRVKRKDIRDRRHKIVKRISVEWGRATEA